ncbi:MAG: FAD-dependent oxidoreductase [Clostridiales bacterium]|jgi:hypothetical protein|nr:FAD-dependent oxidoreductase [Clostridiales bacterium]
MKTFIEKQYDFVVIGGGISGLCAALAAARGGAKTALVQDRPVLGGNASSEIKMHICGADIHANRREARETGIVEELQLVNRLCNPQHSFHVQDMVFWDIARREKNLDLYLNTRALEVTVRDNRIQTVTAHQMTTEKDFVFAASYFADTTGDAMIAARAGAELLDGEGVAMGNSIMFTARDTGRPTPFVKPDWAHTYVEGDFRFRPHGSIGSGYWWIEYGGDELDPVADAEEIRDELMKIVFGVWDHIKNGGDHGAENYALEWFNFLPGKRESRRVAGDHVLTESEILSDTTHGDDVAYGGWSMDMHVEGGMKRLDLPPTTYYDTNGIYSIPYRCLYSKNIENLWVGGRAVSVSRKVFGSTRVMATCGVVGQAIGAAAALAVREKVSPRGVLAHIDELRRRLVRDDCYIPGAVNGDESDLARTAEVLSANPTAKRVTDGHSRDEGETGHKFIGAVGEPLRLKLKAAGAVSVLEFKFDSDLSRELTITVSEEIRVRQADFPQSLAKAFRVRLFRNGRTVFRQTYENTVRFRRIRLPKSYPCDEVEVAVLQTFGDASAKIYEVRIYGEERGNRA